MLPNIAFMGKMGAGKTSAAEVLERGYGYQRISFASSLKKIAITLWGPGAITDRGLMQQLGLKMREIDPMVWVSVALTKITNATLPVVVDDLRFPNEYHALRKEGFVIVLVNAHKGQRINRLKANGKLQDESQLDDASETALDGAYPDYIITNATDFEMLQDAVVKIIEWEARKRA